MGTASQRPRHKAPVRAKETPNLRVNRTALKVQRKRRRLASLARNCSGRFFLRSDGNCSSSPASWRFAYRTCANPSPRFLWRKWSGLAKREAPLFRARKFTPFDCPVR